MKLFLSNCLSADVFCCYLSVAMIDMPAQDTPNFHSELCSDSLIVHKKSNNTPRHFDFALKTLISCQEIDLPRHL